MVEILRITDTSSRADLTAAIAECKAKHDRLPKHFDKRRAEIMADIERYIDQLLATPE